MICLLTFIAIGLGNGVNAQCLQSAITTIGSDWFEPYTACNRNVKNTYSFEISGGTTYPVTKPILDVNGYEYSSELYADDYTYGSHVEEWWITALTTSNHRIIIDFMIGLATSNTFTSNCTYTVRYYASGSN